MTGKIYFCCMVFCCALSLFAGGQKEPNSTGVTAFSDYKTWTKVNSETITGDETGFLGPAHKGAKGFREIYVNEIGKSVAAGKVDYPYPVGTIIVKESFSNKNGQKNKLTDITVMVKREQGYNPDNGDWEYLNVAPSLKIRSQGKMGMCMNCHNKIREQDHIFWNSSL